MFHALDAGQLCSYITARCLSVAEDGRHAKDSVIRFENLGGESDGRAKATDIAYEVLENM